MTAREVDEEIKGILDQSHQRAFSTLKAHRDEVQRVTDTLLQEEEIPGAGVLEFVRAGEKE